jgi:cell division protein FtsI (penicillin-binding protein 3)
MGNFFQNYIDLTIQYFNPKKIKSDFNYEFRAYAISGIFSAILFFILIRYAWLCFFPTDLRHKLLNTGNKQFESVVTLMQPRASILDRNGHSLAVSVPSTSLFILTKRMPKDKETLKLVSEQLNIPYSTILQLQKDKHNFVWLRRQLSSIELNKIGSLKRWQNFIGTANEPKRIYPEKDIASQLIGFVGNDGNGLEGLENIYNSKLNSKTIKTQVMRDARGSLVMVTPNDASKPSLGTDHINLSIDLTIQQITQNALKRGVEKAKAKGGSAIVLDVKTGEILSIASYPSYDLNNPPNNAPEARRFRAVMDAIELGSVVKPMWIAKALDLNLITPKTKIFAENGRMSIPGGVIHDTHQHQWLTPEEILKYSSNIGAYKVVQKIGREEFYKALIQVGFGRSPGTHLPGEWPGRIRKPEHWQEIDFANMAFGQGFAISPLQLAHALSIIAGGGMDHGIHLLKLENESNNHKNEENLRYISEKTSKTITKMMESVVEEKGGTGSEARISGVLVGGKTGTAQIWSHETHSYSDRTPVFEGIIPADNPKLAIVVVLDRAGVRPAFGGPLAGPVFAEIGKKTVDYLNSRDIFNMNPYKNEYLSHGSSK